MAAGNDGVKLHDLESFANLVDSLWYPQSPVLDLGSYPSLLFHKCHPFIIHELYCSPGSSIDPQNTSINCIQESRETWEWGL